MKREYKGPLTPLSSLIGLHDCSDQRVVWISHPDCPAEGAFTEQKLYEAWCGRLERHVRSFSRVFCGGSEQELQLLRSADVLLVGGDQPRELINRCLQLAITNHQSGAKVGVIGHHPLALKFWAGVEEPQSGKLFFSQMGLTDVMGLPHDFHWEGFKRETNYLFPDAFSPSVVVSDYLTKHEPVLAGELAGMRPAASPWGTRTFLFSESLAAVQLAKEGHFDLIAPASITWFTDAGVENQTQNRYVNQGETLVAFTATLGRKIDTLTEFIKSVEGEVVVRKRGWKMDGDNQIQSIQSCGLGRFQWVAPHETPIIRGESLHFALLKSLIAGKREEFELLWIGYFQWLRSGQIECTSVSGEKLDCVPSNIRVNQQSKEWTSFDQEWSIEQEMPLSLVVFRAVLGLHQDFPFVIRAGTFNSLSHLYIWTCERLGISPHLRSDAEFESEFQAAVQLQVDQGAYTAFLLELFDRALPDTVVMQCNQDWFQLKGDRVAMQKEITELTKELHAIWNSRAWRWVQRLRRVKKCLIDEWRGT